MEVDGTSLGAFCGIAACTLWWVRQRGFSLQAPEQFIWVGDPVKFNSKRRRLIQGGASKLHVIADFDRTLTKCFVRKGKRGVSAHGALERSTHLSHSYHRKARALFEKYHPLETSGELTMEQKLPFMRDWYRQGHALLIEQRFHRSYLEEAVRSAPMRMREGAGDVMATLARSSIPLLVLSAGLGDVLEEVLRQKTGPLSPSTHVISNRMVFNDEGFLTGFSEPLIHMFNKHERHDSSAPYYDAICSRRNVILLGDGLGDVHMADGIDTDTILTVGFLNERISELWEQYIQKFDVVIVNDGSMQHVHELLNDIIAGQLPEEEH